MNIDEKLCHIQNELKAPKNQYNSFGKYSYRNCEDILEAVKPLCDKYKATLTIRDEIVVIGDRYYVKSTARLYDQEKNTMYVEGVAYAREPQDKKGMDSSQVTGATSSYARKYCLNGLLCIDDTKDADFYDNRQSTKAKKDDAITYQKVTQEQVSELMKFGKDALKPYMEMFGKKSLKELQVREYETIINKLGGK